MTSDDSFEVRNSVPDIAAELFESYCDSKGYKYYKMGFDAKENLVVYRHFKTYEEAELECLTKLIEIVKQQKQK